MKALKEKIHTNIKDNNQENNKEPKIVVPIKRYTELVSIYNKHMKIEHYCKIGLNIFNILVWAFIVVYFSYELIYRILYY